MTAETTTLSLLLARSTFTLSLFIYVRLCRLSIRCSYEETAALKHFSHG